MDFANCVDDSAFGPIVKGCRGDFDFTLKFENIILSMLPSAVFIALSVPRVIFLARRPSIAGGAILQYTKIVGFPQARNTKPLKDATTDGICYM